MLEKLFSQPSTHTTLGETMFWTWAMKHPYLHFGIEVLQTTPLLIALYLGLEITKTIVKRR